MASSTTSLLNSNFGGIRRKNSDFSNEHITCSDCQNVELFFTGLNSGVGIRTAKGNVAVSRDYIDEQLVSIVPADEHIYGMFEAVLDNDTYFFVYTENAEEGKVYTFDKYSTTLDLVKQGLTPTGRVMGNDFTQGWLDMFILSNGVEMVYMYVDTEIHSLLQVEQDSFENEKLYTISGTTVTEKATDAKAVNCKLNATVNGDEVVLTRKNTLDTEVQHIKYYAWVGEEGTFYTTVGMNIFLRDTEDRPVKGLGLANFDSRLWVFDGKVLWYSQKGDCRVFNYVDPEISTSSGFVEFVKSITAIYPYLGSLAVFFSNSSVLLKADATTTFMYDEESPGGCANYDSLVFHGTDLYFYDHTKRGVYSFQQVINGDKTLGPNIAEDVQEELMSITDDRIKEIRALSVVTADRNEVWFLIPIGDDNYSQILIYDYIRGEWVKRKCKKINCFSIVDSILYSAGKEIYEEYIGELFDGEFIDCYYTCSIFNLGADNTLKITKFPPRVTCDGTYRNHFWVKYIKNYNPLKPSKVKEIVGKSYGGVLVWDEGYWDGEAIYMPTNFNASVKLPSATFKALEMTLYTTNSDENFCIKSIEYSKIKVKQV